jgi:hypothetical protein
MANVTRTQSFSIKEETTEGELIAPTAGTDFTPVREGVSIEASVDNIVSDQLSSDIGQSKSFIARETPSASIPKYLKHSGVEGQSPDYGLMVKATLGSETVNSTEYDTVGGSTAGTSSAAAILNVDSGEGVQFSEGQGVLIKDGTNGYTVRNVDSISSDALTLNYNIGSAPASGVNLGKAVHYSPASSGHPTFSAHLYQSDSSNAVHQAIAGCRVSSLSAEFPVNDFASINFDLEGLSAHRNPLIVDSTNDNLDFDDGSVKALTITSKSYSNPKDLAAEIESKFNAASTDTFTVDYDSTSGKFTITSDGVSLDLLWNTGANTGTTIGGLLGFSVAADDTGSLTYLGDNALDYDHGLTPSYDSSEPTIVKCSELLIGGFSRNDNRSSPNASLNVDMTKADVQDFTSCTGVGSSVYTSRQVTFSTTLILQKHEIDDFNDFLDSTTTSVMFNHGEKDGSGNWTPGTVMNVYIPNATVSSNTISDLDGFMVVELEFSAFVNSDKKDLHINLL